MARHDAHNRLLSHLFFIKLNIIIVLPTSLKFTPCTSTITIKWSLIQCLTLGLTNTRDGWRCAEG